MEAVLSLIMTGNTSIPAESLKNKGGREGEEEKREKEVP